MLDDQGGIIERLQNGTLTTSDIQQLIQELQRNANGGVSQFGKTNVSGGSIQDFQVGDRYTGVTPADIRLIVKEMQALQSPGFRLSDRNENDSNDLPLRKLNLDPGTLEAINTRLEVIEEIDRAGFLTEAHRKELRQMKHQLQAFSTLNQELQEIALIGDRLIQSAVAAMQLQLDALKIAGKQLAQEVRTEISSSELTCQKAEAEIFQTFIQRLNNSRVGSDWILQNIDSLVKNASRTISYQYPNLDASEQKLKEFKLSLKYLLEQLSFCLYWGIYDNLDSSDISLVLEIDKYKTAFQSIKAMIPTRLSSEVIKEIELCLDYLIERLPFY